MIVIVVQSQCDTVEFQIMYDFLKIDQIKADFTCQ